MNIQQADLNRTKCHYEQIEVGTKILEKIVTWF